MQLVCSIDIYEKPDLNDPILIEGLPGIGFIANIASLHLIRQLKATRFVDVISASFQDFAVLTEKGNARSPINQLYYYKTENHQRDLIIWYGNTQALTTLGQYELCGKILDIVQDFGCKFVISLGGYKKDEVREIPILHSAATDQGTMKKALALNTRIMVGHIFGIAGLLLGLSKLRNIKGMALLADTVGMSPDSNATKHVILALEKLLSINVDKSNLEDTAKEIRHNLEPFGLIRDLAEEKKKEEQQLRWFI